MVCELINHETRVHYGTGINVCEILSLIYRHLADCHFHLYYSPWLINLQILAFVKVECFAFYSHFLHAKIVLTHHQICTPCINSSELYVDIPICIILISDKQSIIFPGRLCLVSTHSYIHVVILFLNGLLFSENMLFSYFWKHFSFSHHQLLVIHKVQVVRK